MQKETKKCFWFLNVWGGGSTSLEKNPKYFNNKKSFEGSPKTAQEMQMLFLYTIYHIQKIGKRRQNYANICAIFCYGEKNAYFSANISPNFFFNISHLTKVAQIIALIFVLQEKVRICPQILFQKNRKNLQCKN